MPLDFDIWAKGCRPLTGPELLSEQEQALVAAVRAVPKVELHFHVEGAIQAEPKLGGALKEDDKEESAESRFFQTWREAIIGLREEADFIRAAQCVVRGFERTNVVWAEVFVSPPDCEMRPASPLPFAQALRWWLTAFGRTTSSKCEVRLIVDLVRLYPLTKAEQWLDELLEIRSSPGGERIIGVGLGGPQNSNPLRLYRSVFNRARAEGLLCAAHAGEMGSSSDVGEAVFEIQADRIGHGLGLSANPDAYRSLLERRIPIESCPTSSVKTGACSDLRNHPLSDWVADGALVTISTDDAALFRTELTLEFLQLHRAFGWGSEVLAKLITNGFTASTMPATMRETYVTAGRAILAQCP